MINVLSITKNWIARARRAEGEILQSLRDAHACGDHAAEAVAALQLGNWYLGQGRPTDAVACFQLSLVLGRRLRDDAGIAHALLGLGRSQRERGQFADAARCFRDSADYFQECADLSGEAESLAELRTMNEEKVRLAA